jgi:transcriptional regulator with XRE-family HTH domain
LNLGFIHDKCIAMKLATYLEKAGLSQSQFASYSGLSTGTISLLASGKIWLSRDVAQIIALATKGKVTANDFVHYRHERRRKLGDPHVVRHRYGRRGRRGR